MREFSSPHQLKEAVGAELDAGSWLTVTQETVNAFADITGDRQWIHVDRERAGAGPYGGTVAHGYLTLSLISSLVREVYTVRGARLAVNYGLNRVRFPAPVRTGSAVRARVTILSAEDAPDSVQVTALVTIDIQGEQKPACVAETVTRFYV